MVADEGVTLLVGARIKEIRKLQQQTLQQLAKESGLSVAYLSNLERNIISPTIEQLQRVCYALDVDMLDVLHEASESFNPLVKYHERRVFFGEYKRVKYEMLSEGDNDLEGVCVTVMEGIDYERTSPGHDHDEIAIVTEGTLCIEMLNQRYIINAGDSIYVKKNVLHTFKNVNKGKCVSYWFYKIK